MTNFKEYFVSSLNEAKVEVPVKKEKQKISTDFEQELRKSYKIKSVINTLFGVQIDFYKKPVKDEILALVDSKVKFKDTSIFIEFN